MKRFAFLITLVLILTGSVVAQSKGPRSGEPLWGTTIIIPKMTGMEVSPGTIDYVDNICWGRTFLSMSDTGGFTFMPNYTINTKSEPAEYYSKFTGGAWTLSYKSEKQEGMLFGEVRGGDIEWYTDKNGNVTFGRVTANLDIKGGTGSFEQIGEPYHYGTFTGYIDYATGSPVLEGTLELDF